MRTKKIAGTLFLVLAFAALPHALYATDLNQADWSETDSANNGTPPNGWPGGTMLPSQVEPAARAIRGALKRWYDHAGPTVTSAGTANAQTLTYSVAPTAYVTGDGYIFTVGAGLANTGPATLNVNGLGARNILIGTTPLAGDELYPGAAVAVYYDGTEFQLLSPAARSPAPNIVLNGAMEIDQAHEGASLALSPSLSTATYVLDGWEGSFNSTTATGVACQRVADAPPGFVDSFKCTVGTGASSVAASDYLKIEQPIEADTMTGAGFGTSAPQNLCVSFWAKTSIAPYTGTLSFVDPLGSSPMRTYPVNFSLSAANTWTLESACFPADTNPVWAIGGNRVEGLLRFAFVAGSTYQGTNGTWQTGNLFGTPQTSSSILTTSGSFFEVTGVKLEISPVPTPYVRLPFGAELATAQRYYQKSYDPGTAPGAANTINMSVEGESAQTIPNGGNLLMLAPFKVSMRCDPTVTLYSPVTGTPGAASINSTDNVASAGEIGANGFSNVVNGNGTTWTAPFNWAVNFVADCRL